VFKWHKSFTLERSSLEDDEHIIHQRTVRTELQIKDRTFVHANHSQMVDDVAAGIIHGMCHRILSDGLNMSRVTQYSVNKHYFQILKHLCNSVCRKHPRLWHRKNCLLLHDKALAQCSVLAQEQLAKQQVAILPHPTYSLDLTPCNFFLFPHLKEKLHER
jgi:hypothetical protein